MGYELGLGFYAPVRFYTTHYKEEKIVSCLHFTYPCWDGGNVSSTIGALPVLGIVVQLHVDDFISELYHNTNWRGGERLYNVCFSSNMGQHI